MAERNQDDAADQLAGGTEARGIGPLVNVGGRSGGTNSIAGNGGSMPDRGPASPPGGGAPDQRGTNNLAKQDAEAAFEDGTRMPSGTEAKQWARDDADVDTTAGTPYGGVAPDRQVHKMQRDKD
jgi:hypothetical protein